uniref:RING-type domain-containing protein n=1 Tax=Phaeomonas parva TaxID=124430 RepID=A0A7S1XWB5_9STRA|mmetsp:Transcript_39295/g.123031  ORF Transcript_39295/g.123031 Transcript_39295/m.123031 type:complete len:800 (+) Transcript_39295:157-2556(+)|eukprot:CAMPEP_0118855312 /NCGR_PEP_ID=MMETSP1163-20130328/3183_1 /TAXON_ID=124430 /ORGANISM="Phaeomonas parva, Strain CCMP2877" /LENGTH=799 /DNA_ID=CAMNT_0006788187 /DNA_START=71 /DNA_END=2470 /DNA_ORIENTATION=-
MAAAVVSDAGARMSGGAGGAAVAAESAPDPALAAFEDCALVEIVHLHRALRGELRSLLASVSALAECREAECGSQVLHIMSQFNLLWAVFRAHSKAEDDVIWPALRAKGANVEHDSDDPDAPLPEVDEAEYEEEHKEERRMFSEMDGMLKSLRRLGGQSSPEWGDLVLCLGRTAAAIVENLNEHLDKEEKGAMPLVKRLLSTEEIEALVGEIMGKRSTTMMTMLLRMVVRNLPPEDQRDMIKHLRHSAEGTFFERWLAHGGFVFDDNNKKPGGDAADGADGKSAGADGDIAMRPRPTDSGAFTGCFCYNSCPACSSAPKFVGEPDCDVAPAEVVEEDAKPAPVAVGPAPSPGGSEGKGDGVTGSAIAAEGGSASASTSQFIPGMQPENPLTCVVCCAMDGCPAQSSQKPGATAEEIKVQRDQGLVRLVSLLKARGVTPLKTSEMLQKVRNSRWMNLARTRSGSSDGAPPVGQSPRPMKRQRRIETPAGMIPSTIHPAMHLVWNGEKYVEGPNDAAFSIEEVCVTKHPSQQLGCPHYKRKVKLRAPCCDKLVTCRLCHDQACDHMMNRFAVEEMLCMVCGTLQPVKGICANEKCKHSSPEEPLSTYYCDVCHLFDDDPDKHIYHCPYCNVCRAGRGLGIDYRHCMRCNACVRLNAEHKCLDQVLQGACPICLEEVFRSTRPIKALKCGHVMHKDCYQSYRQQAYTCPICWKSVDDMSEYFTQLDSYISHLPMPTEFLNFRSHILCHDCDTKSWVPFHFAYHKCTNCVSFNTRLLEKVNVLEQQQALSTMTSEAPPSETSL